MVQRDCCPAECKGYQREVQKTCASAFDPLPMQTCSAPAEALLDFREAGPPGFALPRNLDEPEDERVMVLDPKDGQAWRSQVPLDAAMRRNACCSMKTALEARRFGNDAV